MVFQNPSSEAIQGLLERIKTIGIVGLSPNPERPSNRIGRRLMGRGYRVIPVRPNVREILGERAYPTIGSVPIRIDLVNVFRSANELMAVVDECIACDVPALWIQLGIVNGSAAERARSASMFVVMNRCICAEYRTLIESTRHG